MPIELNNMIVRAENVMSSNIDDEIEIMSLTGKNPIRLDEIGRHIWDILAEPCRMDDLCNRLSLEYGAHPDHIADDLSSFLEGLRDEGLIILTG